MLGIRKDKECIGALNAGEFLFQSEIHCIQTYQQLYPCVPRVASTARCWRIPSDDVVINAMGLNNDGAEAIAAKLRGLKAKAESV